MSLFNQALKAGVSRFVVVGSCFEYGRSADRFESIPTHAPLEPTNTYAVSKAAASIALCQWVDEQDVFLDLIRVFHVMAMVVYLFLAPQGEQRYQVLISPCPLRVNT